MVLDNVIDQIMTIVQSGRYNVGTSERYNVTMFTFMYRLTVCCLHTLSVVNTSAFAIRHHALLILIYFLIHRYSF